MSVIYVLWLREVKRYLRSRPQIIASLGQPLLYLLVLGFGLGRVTQIAGSGSYLQFIAPGVICMPPMYVNIGAWVGEGSMIDSHALVGSCAQVGARVHVSAAAQIGGVIEPVGAMPVIVEDDALIGGNTGIYEGAIVKARAVIAAGLRSGR